MFQQMQCLGSHSMVTICFFSISFFSSQFMLKLMLWKKQFKIIYFFHASPYLSNQTSIKRFGSTLWVTNKWFVSKVMQVASSYQTITTIVSRTTNCKNTVVLTWFVNLPKDKLNFKRQPESSSQLFQQIKFSSVIILFPPLLPHESWQFQRY